MRELKERYNPIIEIRLNSIGQRLADDMPLEERHRDYSFTGIWSDYRDCDFATRRQRILDSMVSLN